MRRTALVILSATVLFAPLAALALQGSFSDVYSGASEEQAVVYLHDKGILNGFSDNTFRPDNHLNRAEAAKIFTLLAGGTSSSVCRSDFSDVDPASWYAPYVCRAKALGIMKGGADGRFHPGDRLTLAELSQMAVRALGIDVTALAPGEEWYAPAVRAIADRSAVPPSLGHAEQVVTRGEMAQILWRLQTDRRDLSAAKTGSLLADNCQDVPSLSIPGVNVDEVRRSWLGWVNDLRHDRGLTPYAYDRSLDWTAGTWANHALEAGTISHKRQADSAYYDYGQIEGWFEKLGLTFKNVDRITFTENIGWGVYRCPSGGDCTGAFIDAVRTTFDFYTSEEGSGGPHWRSLVQPNFRLIGLGLAVDSGSRKYFLTVHYGTQITSDPRPVCP